MKKDQWFSLGLVFGAIGWLVLQHQLRKRKPPTQAVATLANKKMLSRYGKNGKVLIMQNPGQA